MGVSAFKRMSPVSMPISVIMVVMPVTGSPLTMAHWMGAAPRYLGRREPWTLMQPCLGISRFSWDRSWPKAAVTIRSGAKSCKAATPSGALILSNWYTGIPSSRAAALAAGGVNTAFRPTGRSGWVKRASSWPRLWSIFNEGTAKSGVPRKAILICGSAPDNRRGVP